MKGITNTIVLFLIPLLIAGIPYRVTPFIVILAILVLRVCTLNKHTAGFFLLSYGGQIGACIRFEFPFLPIYGLMLILLGLLLMWDMRTVVLSQKSSIVGFLIVLIYFFLAYIFSPNVGERVASNKMADMLQNGLFMFYGFCVFSRSTSINTEKLCQCLFLSSLLFIVHDMELLNIAPSSIFDYGWLRFSSENLFYSDSDDPILMTFIGYQPIGMAALYGYAIFLSNINVNRPKLYFYTILALQLTLLSGARQAVFGFFIIVVLRFTLFNLKITHSSNTGKIKSFVIGLIGLYFAIMFIHSLGISYLSDTISFGDDGREDLLHAAWLLFFKYPLFGTGIGGFHHYTHMLYPHNFFAELMCEVGVVGILFLSIIVFNHFKKHKMSVRFLTRNNSLLFLVVAALAIRFMVSGDLSSSIELFSAVFACTARAQSLNA